MLRPTTALALASAAVLAGCGNARTAPPDVAAPPAPRGFTAVSALQAGLTFTTPGGWLRLAAPTPPLIASVSGGRATLSVFRYPRTEPLPRTTAGLRAAGAALLAAAKVRDATVVELKRSIARVDGKPAVVLRVTETIDGQLRTVRSTHVYADGGEVVVDAIAPAADFARVDAEVFLPVVRSLQLSRPAA